MFAFAGIRTHEADLLTRILEVQREAIKKAIGGAEQLRLEFEPEDRFQDEQFKKDLLSQSKAGGRTLIG